MDTNQTISRRKALAGLGLAAGASVLPLSSFSAAKTNPNTRNEQSFTYCLNMSTIRGQKLGFMKELEIAAQAGYDGVEIWVDALKGYIENGGTAQQVKKRLNDLGLKAENAIGFAQWIVDDESTRKKGLEQAKQEMELLAQVGCLRTAAPPTGATEQAGLDLTKAGERYHALLELGEQTGVAPHLELWGFSQNLHSLAQVLYVAAASNHPKARVLADVYHLYKGGSDFDSLHLIGGKAMEVFHMNDYPENITREQAKDSDRVYPGDGVAPLAKILRTLQESGSPKVLSLELFNTSYWQQDALEVAKTGLAKMKNAVQMAMKS